MDVEAPSLEAIREARRQLGDLVLTTPSWHWHSPLMASLLGEETRVYLKLELLQHTGTFKPRGALMVMKSLSEAELAKGVAAVSAGNHAIAVAYAARIMGTTAKVVMPRTANPFRVQRCKSYGAEVILADDVQHAFDEGNRIAESEGRHLVHPFEGPLTALGTATVGLEFMEQVPGLEAVIVPIGGGGLCAGIASAVKQLDSTCLVFGVEPTGADTMRRSFEAGSPQAIDEVTTIADSLGAPYAMPYSFGLCRRFVDELVMIEDDDMRRAMGTLFADMKLAVEPAGSAATAALLGPLRERLRGKRVGVLVCGSNIDLETFARQAIVDLPAMD